MIAYTHDLGMALIEDEHRKIFDETQDTPERRSFLRYRNSFAEELKQIDRWHERKAEAERQIALIENGDYGHNAGKASDCCYEIKAEADSRIRLIEGHIHASYIRETHANEDADRVGRWLDEIVEVLDNKSLFIYGDYSFRYDLALISTSHGKSVSWLREQFSNRGREDGFYQLVGAAEWANLAEAWS